MKKIVVGISGGIDSAVTAYKLKQEGYEVVGAYLKITDKLWVPKENLTKIAEILQIPITIVDGVAAFKETVLAAFRKDHLAGRTPSPCATCNPTLKWKLLFDFADAQGAEWIASGHYIQKEKRGNRWYLKKGKDVLKDQSYYLWGLSQSQLTRIITPLGLNNKTEVKELARKIGFDFLLHQKESSGLCFSEGLSYPELLRKYIPEAVNIPEGEVINNLGEVVGTHQGYIYYTIGQKKNIDFFKDENQGNCVISIEPASNRILVGPNEDLWVKEFEINQCCFVDEQHLLESDTIEVKVRGIGINPQGFAKIIKLGNDRYKVQLSDKAWAMAPGQPVVFYEAAYLLGGGFMNSL
jgi:tRNA-specific 2-thiouridylase